MRGFCVMNILHVANLAGVGGAERYFLGFMESAINDYPDLQQAVMLSGAGVHPYFINTLKKSEIQLLSKKHLRTIKIPGWPRAIRRHYWRRIGKSMNPGVALFWNQLRNVEVARALKKGGLMTAYWERGTGWHVPYSDARASAMLASVDCVLANSRAGIRILRHRGLKAPAGVCMNGLRPDIYHMKLPRRQPPSDRQWRIGVACRLVPYKGVALALHALATLRSAGYDARMEVAGTGPDAASLALLAEHLNLVSNIDFLGVIDDMTSFYRRIDVLLHPALCEPCSNSVAEALHHGCPVIATLVDGIPEVMLDDSGVMVPATLDAEAYADLGVATEGQPPWVYDPNTGGVRRPKASSPRALADAVIWVCEDKARYQSISANAMRHSRNKMDPAVRYAELLENLAELTDRKKISNELASAD